MVSSLPGNAPKDPDENPAADDSARLSKDLRCPADDKSAMVSALPGVVTFGTFLLESYQKFPHFLGISADAQLIEMVHEYQETHGSSMAGSSSAFRVYFLRGTAMRTRSGLFSEFAAVLEFPAYFGENWDALWDMLTDLHWLPRWKNLVLVMLDAQEILREDSLETSRQFTDIISQLNAYWNPQQQVQQPACSDVIKADAGSSAHAIRILCYPYRSDQNDQFLCRLFGSAAPYVIVSGKL